MPSLLVLTDADVAAVLDPPSALNSQREAFAALGHGSAEQPARLLLPGQDDAMAFCYAARVGPQTPAVSKVGAVHPGNSERGLPAVHALVTVLDATTGAPAAVISGEALTTLRTAAASALAADHLSAPDAGDLALVGAGVQARAHLQALAEVRTLRRLRVFTRTRAAGEKLAQWWSHQAPDGPPLEVASSVSEAVRDADLVALCTTSSQPVVDNAALSPGTFVVTVGSFRPDHAEVPQETMETARVVVDHRDTGLAQCGSVVNALAAGVLEPDRVETLGDIVASQERHHDDERVTVYGSVGLGVQDAAAAAVVLDRARVAGRGQAVNL